MSLYMVVHSVKVSPEQFTSAMESEEMPEFARAMFSGTMYSRMAEIVQLLGSSSLMGLPTEADFSAEIAPELDRYLATDSIDARGRVRLFHLAWDVACSAFGGRQTHCMPRPRPDGTVLPGPAHLWNL